MQFRQRCSPRLLTLDLHVVGFSSACHPAQTNDTCMYPAPEFTQKSDVCKTLSCEMTRSWTRRILLHCEFLRQKSNKLRTPSNTKSLIKLMYHSTKNLFLMVLLTTMVILLNIGLHWLYFWSESSKHVSRHEQLTLMLRNLGKFVWRKLIGFKLTNQI